MDVTDEKIAASMITSKEYNQQLVLHDCTLEYAIAGDLDSTKTIIILSQHRYQACFITQIALNKKLRIILLEYPDANKFIPDVRITKQFSTIFKQFIDHLQLKKFGLLGNENCALFAQFLANEYKAQVLQPVLLFAPVFKHSYQPLTPILSPLTPILSPLSMLTKPILSTLNSFTNLMFSESEKQLINSKGGQLIYDKITDKQIPPDDFNLQNNTLTIVYYGTKDKYVEEIRSITEKMPFGVLHLVKEGTNNLIYDQTVQSLAFDQFNTRN
ncbi:hypothetical protein HDV06_004014 [Boothiomyces sp. JEL0866]|nr:hypothetical protein HDV06_004014 [Boothiomyces sp. JEL0866]